MLGNVGASCCRCSAVQCVSVCVCVCLKFRALHHLQLLQFKLRPTTLLQHWLMFCHRLNRLQVVLEMQPLRSKLVFVTPFRPSFRFYLVHFVRFGFSHAHLTFVLPFVHPTHEATTVFPWDAHWAPWRPMGRHVSPMGTPILPREVTWRS